MRLLYFSPVAADSYAQRPHFMVRAWLEWGIRSVLWVNPYPCRLPRPSDLRRGPGSSKQSSQCDPRVDVLNVPALPIEPLPLGPEFNRHIFGRSAWRKIEQFVSDDDTVIGVGRPSALAAAALKELHPSSSFYDAMDNFPEFHTGLSRKAMFRNEQIIAERADLIVASSTFLADKFIRRGLRVEKVLNACEINDGRGTRDEERVVSVKPQATNTQSPIPESPILGYIGCIGRWFDWPLVIRLARSMPEARFELVGPCVVKPPERLPDNVNMSPACKHSETIGLMSRFSAGLIPFEINALTAGVDPIKYYEYRAAGLPVLSTSFGEMAMRGRDDGVYFLDQDYPVERVREAVGRQFDPSDTSRFRHENNWRCRYQGSGLLSLLCASRRKLAA